MPAPSADEPDPLATAGGRRDPRPRPVETSPDATVTKQVPISKTVRAVAVVQANNVFNHAPLDNPVTDMASADFGLVTTRSAAPRTLRVGVRLLF